MRLRTTVPASRKKAVASTKVRRSSGVGAWDNPRRPAPRTSGFSVSSVVLVAGDRPKASIRIEGPAGSLTVVSRWVGNYIWTGIEGRDAKSADSAKGGELARLTALARGKTQAALLNHPDVVSGLRALGYGGQRHG